MTATSPDRYSLPERPSQSSRQVTAAAASGSHQSLRHQRSAPTEPRAGRRHCVAVAPCSGLRELGVNTAPSIDVGRDKVTEIPMTATSPDRYSLPKRPSQSSRQVTAAAASGSHQSLRHQRSAPTEPRTGRRHCVAVAPCSGLRELREPHEANEPPRRGRKLLPPIPSHYTPPGTVVLTVAAAPAATMKRIDRASVPKGPICTIG